MRLRFIGDEAAAVRTLAAAAIPDEKKSEKSVLRRALGASRQGIKFDSAKGYAHYVREFINTMIHDGTKEVLS